MVASYKTGIPLCEIANIAGVSHSKVIKLLVTEGVFTSNTYDQIKRLREEGKTEEEIANICGLGTSGMWMYTPYTKGIYNSENPTHNALRIREWRKKHK